MNNHGKRSKEERRRGFEGTKRWKKKEERGIIVFLLWSEKRRGAFVHSKGEKNKRRGAELCFLFLSFLLLKSLIRSR